MRILIATWHRNVVGGTERYLQALIPGLLQQGHQVGLVYEREAQPGLETIDPGQPTQHKWCFATLGLERLMAGLGEWNPDVVYSHGLEDDGLEKALLDKFKTVLFAHGYYGTCGTGNKCLSFPRVEPCMRRFGPACALLHYPRRCGGLSPWSTLRIYQRQASRRARLPQYRAVLVASTHMHNEFSRHGVRDDRLHLVPLPTTHLCPDLPPKPQIPLGRLLFIGRLTRFKGAQYLIEAIAGATKQLGRQLTLSVAGEGPARAELERSAVAHGLTVEFVGWVEPRRKLDLMRQADLLVVPSVWPEPFGLVGIEAGSLGVPAVGFAVGGIPDWLIPGHSGELAPGSPPTVQGLADAIIRALGNAEHYASLCRGARESADRFTLKSHLERLITLLTSVCPGPVRLGVYPPTPLARKV